MALKHCQTTFSAQRRASSSSLKLKLFFRYSRLAIERMGRRASLGATAASIADHARRVDSTTSGCFRSIIASNCEREKSGFAMPQIPQESPRPITIAEDSVDRE